MAVAKNNKKTKVAEQDIFIWQGVNRRGLKVNGELPAESIKAARDTLKQQGINPTKLKKKPKPLFGGGAKKITAKDIAVMTRQLATMLSAGVPLVQSVELISKGNENANMRRLLMEVGLGIQSGTPLNEVLRQHPKYFDDLYCDLVMAGEQSGALEGIYDRIATYKEKSEALKSKIKKAMTYPIAVLSIASIVTIILLIFVVPQFQEIFASFGAELPAFTLMVIGMSETLQAHGPKIAVAVAIGIFVFVRSYKNSRKLRDKVDAYLLKMPIFGMILNKASLARFARTLATTFAAGVPLIEALDSAAGASGNAVYRNAIMNIKAEVSAGMQMNIAMRNTKLFPDMVIQMVQIGEESGAIDDMLNKVATVYEQEVDDAVDGLSALIEPMIMAFLGVVIGGLIVAMYLPIFQLGKIVS
ncbi:type IV pilus biogenesis protein PilC [Catenovulum agarivorans DS-2]|uniref:Type IV pilus biogenesis protein PilC n=1 Tax=Catenovulum agarivorans DS-2 TaxID=1328313 RepID=W7QXN1_9ALTE|nr:type II secretion system F family protein [Catenovulum agarivorans]EWH10045.1 type IV pilus biogenesis protein PilC [Catenovulum agarivorans DS-2]